MQCMRITQYAYERPGQSLSGSLIQALDRLQPRCSVGLWSLPRLDWGDATVRPLSVVSRTHFFLAAQLRSSVFDDIWLVPCHMNLCVHLLIHSDFLL